jgi:hypothetical protein
MTERAAHLLDAVLPWVPVRRWVLTVPYRLRYQMAWNHGLSRCGYTRACCSKCTRRAWECGVPGGRTGSVTVMQRGGSRSIDPPLRRTKTKGEESLGAPAEAEPIGSLISKLIDSISPYRRERLGRGEVPGLIEQARLAMLRTP